MSTVTSSATFSVTEKSLPRISGEKERASRCTSITGGELLRRCATKKAAKVAPTSTRKVMRATSVTVSPRLVAALVGADDHDDILAAAVGLRGGVDRLDVLDVEDPGDVLGAGAGAVRIHDHRGGALLVARRVVAGARVGLLVAGRQQLVLRARRQADLGRAVEHGHGGRRAVGRRRRLGLGAAVRRRRLARRDDRVLVG